MKLKRILAGVLTGAMMITGIPAFGLEMAASVPVYADEPADSTGAAGADYTNLAQGKSVRTDGTTEGSASNVTDGKTDTTWTSGDLNKISPQYLEIDLQDVRTNIDHMKLTFGAAWDGTYSIYTYENKNGADTTWHLVKTVATTGPSGEIPTSEGLEEGREGLVDTIVRNDDTERIVLRRYVRIVFAKANAPEGTNVSVAEVEINGVTSQRVYGPEIVVPVPETGKYPKDAVIKADDNNAAYHQNLRDRTVPQATLLKGDFANQEDIAPGNITDAMMFNKVSTEGVEGDYAMYKKDGIYGFNALARTPGKDNKFNANADDVRVIHFQIYPTKRPEKNVVNWEDLGAIDILGKGNKYAVQMTNDGIQVFMHAESSWPTQAYDVTDWNSFLNKWHTVMAVFDGKGRMRLYVDGQASRNSAGGEDASEFNAGIEDKHFTIGYNEATKQGGSRTFKDYGYIARLKFYSSADLTGHVNGAGTDISDAKQISEETAEAIDIVRLEGSNPTSERKDEVHDIIVNYLNKENPTLRITLCPYDRKTIWQEYNTETSKWVDMDEETGRFEDNKKYRAVTTLEADDGYIFDSACRERVYQNLKLSDENYDENKTCHTVEVMDKNRELVATTYFNLTDGAADSVVEAVEICSIEEVIIGDEEVYLTYDENADSQTAVELEKAEARIGELCVKHQDATADVTYELSAGADAYVTMNAEGDKITLTPKKESKAMLGYEPVSIIVTATLKDSSGNVINRKGTQTPVAETGTINIYIDKKQEDKTITRAPTVTIKAPNIDSYPEVAEVALADEGIYFDDIADRMEPTATLNPLTGDYIKTSEYITSESAHKPGDAWVNAWKNEPDIQNIDGIVGFNAQAQTPGTTNKFDVFGNDIKLVSFKLYLKEWPTGKTAADGTQYDNVVSVYGKGNKYAFQVTAGKEIVMFMKSAAGQAVPWPQETFVPEDKEGFLNKWHNIFMVVDGKGWQRLYVDGKPSSTRGGNGNQGSAIAAETTGAQRKPFTLGYNSKDNHPSWYNAMFTKKYGYIADFEFYSDKNYDNIVNGSGTDITTAETLSKNPDLVKKIDLQKLEEDYGQENVGIVLTSMLQESNATASITATPFVAKTNWSQKDDEGNVTKLDKINLKPFTYASQYVSVTTLTAYEGFKFSSEESFTNAVEENFTTEGTAEGGDPEVKVVVKEDGKVLEITATYGKTAEAPCTCEMAITPPAPVEIEIAAGQATGTGTLGNTDETDITLNCLKGDHISEKKYSLEYGIKAGDEDKIDFDLDTKKVTAKKAGTAHITLTATLQTKNDSGEWVDYTNADPKGAKKVTKTIEIAVNVTRADAASAAEKTGLTTEINNAKKEYPDSVADDYEADAWQELQDALAEAAELAKANNLDATTSQITASKARIAAAIEALAGKKSEKGKAKDALKSVLDDEALKALITGNNADKKYTEDSFKKLTDAYAEAESKLTTADAATLGTLKTALETAWKGLEEEKTVTPPPAETGVKDGDALKGADGAQYQVASAKDKTVIITKGVDAKTIKVGPTVVINKETYKVIGIGNSAYAGLKKATKVIINANVASIGDQAFAKSKKLKNVTFGADVAKIGKKAFFNCPKLNKVILKGTALNNKSIGKQAFQKTAKKVTVKWGKVKGKQRTQLKKALKKAKLKVK